MTRGLQTKMIEKIGITLTDVMLKLTGKGRLRHPSHLEHIVKTDLVPEPGESEMQSLSDSDNIARCTVERIRTG